MLQMCDHNRLIRGHSDRGIHWGEFGSERKRKQRGVTQECLVKKINLGFPTSF